MIKIKRIRVNFQIRFGYNLELTNYIKTLPRDQISTHMEPIVVGGQTIEDWFRICNIAGLSKVLWYCWDKNIQVQYENIKASDIERIENFARNKKKRIDSAMFLKNGGFNAQEIDFSFLKHPPYPYQKEDIQFFEAVDGIAILGSQPGIGKSLSALGYAYKHKLKTLILCPASLKLNWKNEIMFFTDEKPFIFKYKPSKKSSNVNYPPEATIFHIINYESLETYFKFDIKHTCKNQFCNWEEINKNKKYKICPKCFKPKTVTSRITDLVSFIDKTGMGLNLNEYDLLIADESHYLKETKTHRTKLVKSAFKNTPKKLLLTGTAIKNRPYEFFSLLNFLDEYEWSNQHNFGIRYCDGKENEYGHWEYKGASNLDELFERISHLFLRRLKKDVLKFLPPKTITIIPIEMTPEEERMYRRIEKDIREEAKVNHDRMSLLALVQKQKQFTSMLNAHRAIEFIQNVIDSGEKIVVFSQFLKTVNFIYEKFKEQSVIFTGKHDMSQKQQAVDSFMKDDEIKVFVGSVQAAGVGITLTSASTVLFLDQVFDPGGREQAEDRCHRASQKSDKVQIIRLICQDTIDEDIDKLLDEKEKILSKVLDGKESINRKDFSIFNDLIKIMFDKSFE